MPLLYPYDYDTTNGISARSFSSEITPNATQRTTLIIAGCYIIIIGILWYVLTDPPSLFNKRAGHVCRHVPYLNLISAFSHSFWSTVVFFVGLTIDSILLPVYPFKYVSSHFLLSF